MTDHTRHRQAQNIADVVMHHTQEVNELIGLYKQQAASLDQLTDIMARLTRVLENVSSEISKETTGLNSSNQANGKGVFPLFMGRHSRSTRGSSEW
jgi:methyl-accepting chemotaxis protein